MSVECLEQVANLVEAVLDEVEGDIDIDGTRPKRIEYDAAPKLAQFFKLVVARRGSSVAECRVAVTKWFEHLRFQAPEVGGSARGYVVKEDGDNIYVGIYGYTPGKKRDRTNERTHE